VLLVNFGPVEDDETEEIELPPTEEIPNLSETSNDIAVKSSCCFRNKKRKVVQDTAVLDKDPPVLSHNSSKEIKTK
jgi:hypothetical protein